MTKLGTTALAAVLCCGGPAGCAGEGVADVEGQERPALVGGVIDAGTTGVLAIFVSTGAQWLFECTGTLVAPNVILTAGHCVLAWDPEATTAAALCGGNGVPRLARPEDIVAVSGVRADQSAYRVERIAVPPTNDGSQGPDLCGRDIALLVLEQPMPSSEAQPVDVRLSPGTSPGEAFDTVGFGADAALAIPAENVRRRASGSVACVAPDCDPDEDVHAGEWLSSDIFACSGDSGAPALDQAGKIIGVVSRGFRDCHSIIYEDTSYSAAFLEHEISAASAAVTAQEPANGSTPREPEPVPTRCSSSIDRDRRHRSPLLPLLPAAGFLAAAMTRRLRRGRGGAL